MFELQNLGLEALLPNWKLLVFVVAVAAEEYHHYHHSESLALMGRCGGGGGGDDNGVGHPICHSWKLVAHEVIQDALGGVVLFLGVGGIEWEPCCCRFSFPAP